MKHTFVIDRLLDLIAERKAEGMSQRKLSMELGHGESYVNKIVNGHNYLSVDEFLFICEELNITPAQFFAEELSPAQIRFLNELEYLTDEDLDYLMTTITYIKQKNRASKQKPIPKP